MKRAVSIALTFCFLLNLSISCFAFAAEDHDSYMNSVIFGNSFTADKKSEILSAASYLTIDQYSGNGQDKLDVLEKNNIKKLPSLSDIDFNGNQHHRKYTHLGWNHSYSDDKANWNERKTILLSSASKIFKFGFFNGWFGYYNDKCDSFCALVYYIHILGDCIDYSDKNDGLSDDVIPLVAVNPSLQEPDVFYELKHYLGILFSGQKNTTSYSSMMQEIENYEINARAIISGNTVDAFELATIEDDLMQALSNYVYPLLQNEQFYAGGQNLFTRKKNWLFNR